MCPRCRSFDARFDPVSGRGHPPRLPFFAERAPCLVAVAELVEDPGLRMIGGRVDCRREAARIGMAVEGSFDDAGEGIRLPPWRPSEEADGGAGTR
jgi:uncharacterized OB-fold protein